MAHPGKAFVSGWAGTAALAFAVGIALDVFAQSSGTDGMQGVGALVVLLLVLAGVFILGPVVGLVCAVVAWLRGRGNVPD